MSDNKYKLFRNFMVNELGISREDIKEWTKEAVKETAEKILKGMDVESIISSAARRMIDNDYSNQMRLNRVFQDTVEKIIREKLVVSIGLKNDPGAKP